MSDRAQAGLAGKVAGANQADQSNHADMQQYYARRAPEYEQFYAKPERQSDLAEMTVAVRDTFRDRRVIEIACGTGWWSQHIAQVARSLDAFDINEETLAIARSKDVPEGRARFAVGDAYRPTPRSSVSRPSSSPVSQPSSPSPVTQPSPMPDAVPDVAYNAAYDVAPDAAYDAAFAGFWWSHVLKRDLARFLEGLHRVLAPGATVVFLDNRYVEGSSTPVSRIDENGDGWQSRPLSDGTRHEVLKNFPSAAELESAVAPYASHVTVKLYDYFWWLQYTLADKSPAETSAMQPIPQPANG